MRFLATLTIAAAAIGLAGCGPSYSPDTYATNAAQQANKVEAGVIAGVRPVHISAQGTVGGVAGAAAGGVAGSTVGTGTTSAFAAIGGSLIGGIAGVATEHVIGDADGFEYVVRKSNGEMVSVAQKDPKPLLVGQKVLVIAGPQARIVPDYTVPFEAPPKVAAKPAVAPPSADAHPAPADNASHPQAAEPAAPSQAEPASRPPAAAETLPPLPAEPGVPPALPSASGSPATPPPPVITPAAVPAPAAPVVEVPKP